MEGGQRQGRLGCIQGGKNLERVGQLPFFMVMTDVLKSVEAISTRQRLSQSQGAIAHRRAQQ
jgi:hypothetical protein